MLVFFDLVNEKNFYVIKVGKFKDLFFYKFLMREVVNCICVKFIELFLYIVSIFSLIWWLYWFEKIVILFYFRFIV